MKHRWQGDKKPLASEGRDLSLILDQPWGGASLADGVFFN